MIHKLPDEVCKSNTFSFKGGFGCQNKTKKKTLRNTELEEGKCLAHCYCSSNTETRNSLQDGAGNYPKG